MGAVVRLVLLLLGVLVLAGCGGSPVRKDHIDPGDLDNIASAGPSVADVLARGNDTVPVEPAPVGFDHHGDWAATPALCRGGRWRFGADEVDVGGEGRCRVTARETVSADATALTVTCKAEGIETIERWSLVRREDGRMTVARTQGGNGVPRSVVLGPCG